VEGETCACLVFVCELCEMQVEGETCACRVSATNASYSTEGASLREMRSRVRSLPASAG